MDLGEIERVIEVERLEDPITVPVQPRPAELVPSHSNARA
jgi:hypothetical protein